MIGDFGTLPASDPDARVNDSEARGSWLDKPLLAALDWERAAYLLILVLAIVSRLYDLGARAMSHDESLHTQFSHYFVTGRGYAHTPLMHGPFLFHVTALSYFLFGDNDFTARLPFAIFGIVLVMLPLLFRKQLGREGALAASFLLLISPSILYHARYIRQEGTILVWSFLTALCVYRYLRTRGSGWLVGLAVVLALHATDKSTNFFTVALFVVFLAPIAVWQIWQARGSSADLRKTLLFAVVIGALMIGASILAELFNSRINGLLDAQALIAGNAGGSLSSLAYFAIILGMGVAMGVLVYTLLKRGFGDWMKVAHDHSPAWNLIVVMVSTTTFMAAPALLLVLNPLWQAVGGEILIDIKLLGDDNSIKTNPQVIGTMASLLVAVGMVGVVLALLWNSERALAIFGVFAGITIPLFTSMFTNTSGIGTGFVGQLGYWMAQHDVQRGGQPPYYYLIVVPLYEYLAIIGFLATLVVLGYQLVMRGLLIRDAASFVMATAPFVQQLRAYLFPIMCCWWAIASWLIFSIAGEKMPWLTVHIALPMIMVTGWFIQRCVDAIRAHPQDGTNRRLQAFGASAGLGVLAVLFTIRALSVVGGYDPAAAPSSRVADLANLVIAAVLIIVSFVALRRFVARGRLAVYGLAAFGVLSLLTIRTAVNVTYINYDYTKEFLFYAHGAPGVKIILNQVDDLSKRLGTTQQLAVGWSQETSWPMTWYMRDFPGARYFGSELPGDFDSLHVVIIGDLDKKYQEWTDQLAGNYTMFEYSMVWWPMEDYKDMTWARLWSNVTNAQKREALWQIAFNRNYEPYAKLHGSTTLTADNWQPARRIRMFVRNDIAAQVWDYRAGNVAGAAKPVVAATVQQPANLAFADGARWAIDHKANHLFKLDESYQPTFSLGGSGNGPGKFNDPWGIAVDSTGAVFVADTFNHRIQKIDANGNVMFVWGQPGATDQPGNGRNTQFFGPRDIVITRKGQLLVTDTGNKRVQVFDTEGNFVTQFGKSGMGEGEFSEPVGLAEDESGNIYIADTWNKRIQVWSADFKYQRAFAVPAWETMDPNLLTSIDHKPYLAVHGDTLYVSSPRTAQVLGFTLSGQPKDLADITFNPDDIPTGVEVANGRLFVTNTKNGAIVDFPLGAAPR